MPKSKEKTQEELYLIELDEKMDEFFSAKRSDRWFSVRSLVEHKRKRESILIEWEGIPHMDHPLFYYQLGQTPIALVTRPYQDFRNYKTYMRMHHALTSHRLVGHFFYRQTYNDGCTDLVIVRSKFAPDNFGHIGFIPKLY